MVIIMTLHIAGRDSDFITDPNIHLLNMLKNNWNPNGADNDSELKVLDEANNASTTGVRFSVDWFNGSSWYQIIVKHLNTTINKITLGSKGYLEHNSYHAIHIFAKGKNALDKIWKLEKEIERILALNMLNMPEGIQLALLQDFKRLSKEDAYESIEHSIATVILRYYKVIV
jgi:hypothetical protein